MRRVHIRTLFLIPLSIFFFLKSSIGAELGVVKSLQETLERSRAILEKAEKRLRSGLSISPEIAELKTLLEEVRASHLLLQERFRGMEEEMRSYGEKALSRHQAMAEGVSRALLDYIALMEGLSLERPPPLSRVEQLLNLLRTILPVKKKPLFGTLPYKHLRYPATEPNQGPSIKPAYRGGDRIVKPEDLKGTSEAPISYEIAMLAQTLNWNPVSIYEWVKNNIETEWYWGSMKGAEETFRQRRGNACDQASLLIALLRASGYPSRYVRGVIEFFPDIERAKNLFGIDDPQRIAEYLQKAGIPFKAVLSGGRISNLQIEHIWVETYVPYANYRGAILDEHGKAWLGLDTSIKVSGYAYNSPKEIPATLFLTDLWTQYLSSPQSQTPLEYLKTYIDSQLANLPQPLTYEELLWTKTLIPEVMNILPASLQFIQRRITHEYTEIPEELKHRVRFIATAGPGKELFDITLDASSLSNRRIALTYEPESREDQEIIHAYGGLSNTPAYLVRLRPVLTLNGERVVAGRDGLPMGKEYELSLELLSPNGRERIVNTHLTGNLSVIGIVSQNASLIINEAEGDKNAEQLLYEEAIRYIERWNRAEDELASLMGLIITRPIPTVVTLGGVIDITSLLDTPHGFEWKGLYVDLDLKAIETVWNSEFGVRDESQKSFMQFSSLQGSILENRLFEDDFRVESISTAKLFGLIRGTQPVTEILTIDKSNIASVLPTLPFDQNIKEDIQNGVNQGLTIRIPQSEIQYEDWTGIGYIKENPETGESGYMLSGMIAGGMTVWGLDRWPQYYQDILQNAYSEPPNLDPSSARYIQKISSTDLQKGKVGEELFQPLQVLVLDSQRKPVSRVEVTFTIKAGGGKFKKNGLGSIKVPTDGKGIASAELILGEKTSANPVYWKESGDKHSTQVGENIVEASLSSGIRTTKPFTAYGFPGDPVVIRQTHGDGRWGTILSFSGFVSISLEDRFGNPVSNRSITFEALNGYLNPNLPNCDHPNRDRREAYLVRVGDPCIEKAPVWGDCGDPAFQMRMVETTSDKGAAVQIILGGLPGGSYPIQASYTDPISDNKLQTTFYHYTYPFGNCSGKEDPAIQLVLEYIQPSDSYGNNINAGPVGARVPVMAKLYFLKEKERQEIHSFTCDGNPILCNKVIGTREYETIMDFKSSKVTFGQEEGKSEGGGLYSGTHTLSLGVNNIPIRGEATLDIRRTEVCPGCVTTTKEFYQDGTLTYQVYGVQILIDPLPVILVDENGYAKQDYSISYTIHPTQYRAMTAFVSILKDGSPITYIPSEVKERGVVTIAGGFQFDVESTYEVEVVLNSGTGVEIRSDRRKLVVGGILVRNANGRIADELRFGDGSDPEKVYHIELVSKVLTENCWALSGKARVINRDGQTINVPVADERKDDFYPPEQELLFVPSTGKCFVWLKDKTVGGLSKVHFILSNLSKEDLNERSFNPENLAVLYGGIGNRLQIEINEAKLELPIEPVGIILIGIDGLRQDVLYPEGKDDVSEGSYRVEIEDLAGMKHILGGFDRSEDNQRYIMLPKVTAIFPSITYASWASIFTGKLPNETGITGNEFFARDLSALTPNPIPGLSKNPQGMVTLSEGAFDNGGNTIFTLAHVIPAEFSGLGIGYHPTLSSKIKDSAPLRSLTGGVKPFFEEIGKITRRKYNIAPQSDIRCDQTSYECRTAAIFFQYVEGVDFWGTPNLSNLFDVVEIIFNPKNFSAKIMDQAPTSRAIDFVENYFSKKVPDGKRKRFPAVFAVYFSGLDHYAHAEGMGGYSAFFKDTTDPQIRDFINALKRHGEFDNKIFIIVSDHGMTEMPTGLKFRINEKIDLQGNVFEITTELPAEMSCSLKLDFRDPADPDQMNIAKEAERNNNNLHIWELAELLKTVGEVVEQTTGQKISNRVLAPAEVAHLFRDPNTLKPLPNGAADKKEQANIIAAFNGPMAHIYAKGMSWETLPEISEVKKIAEIFRVTLQGAKGGDSPLSIFPEGIAEKLRYKIGKLANSIDAILIKEGGAYKVYTVINKVVESKEIGSYFTDTNKYVEALIRLEKMNHEKRSGDIVLLMNDDTGGLARDRYTTGMACKAWHGSLNRSDSYVPFIMSYPGGNKHELEQILGKEEICKADYSNCKGNWKISEILKGLISSQYE